MPRTTAVVVGTALLGAAAGAALLAGLRIAPETAEVAPDLAWLPELAQAAPKVLMVSAFGSGPARFEPNLGQADPSVRWLRRGPSHVTFVRDDGFATVVHAEAEPSLETASPEAHGVSLRFEGALAAPVSVGEGELESRTNYFVGRDPEGWIRNVPNFARVRATGVWPGIDVVYHGRDGRLEYDFVVAPGADPGQVAFTVEGADSVRIDAAGDLVLDAGFAEIRHLRPVVYQESAAGRQVLPGSYVLEGPARVRFHVGRGDPSLPLVIDPVEEIRRRIGGSLRDEAVAVDADALGRVVLGGRTFSTNLSGTGNFAGPIRGLSDGFVTQIATASAQFLDILGSLGDDGVTDLELDTDSTSFVSGFTTDGSTFPVVLAPQTTLAGGQEGTILSIVADGSSLRFSGPIGGAANDLATSLALQPNATGTTLTSVAVGLVTRSASAPLAGSAPGGGDGLVLRYDPAGVQLGGRFFGGPGDEAVSSGSLRTAFVAPDSLAVAFTSTSNNLPMSPGAFQTVPQGSIFGVVSVLPFDLSSILRSTYVSGTVEFPVTALSYVPGTVSVTATASFVVGTEFSSGDLNTTANAPQSTRPGIVNGGFIVLSGDLTEARVISYIGSGTLSTIRGIVPVSATAVYVVGSTSSGFPAAGTGEAPHGSSEIYLAEVSTTGDAYRFATNIGSPGFETNAVSAGATGSQATVGRPVAFLPATGQVVVVGATNATQADFPVLGAEGGSFDAFAFTTGTPSFEPDTTAFFEDLDRPTGRLTDSTAPGRDSFTAKFKFALPESGEPISFVPGGAGSISFSAQAALATVTARAELLDEEIALDAPGWTSKRGGRLVSFASAKGVKPVIKISVDLAKGTCSLNVSRFDLPFRPGDGACIFRLTLGNYVGTADEARLSSSRPGRFSFVAPLKGTRSSLTVTPKVQPLGQPFAISARLENHDASQRTVLVEIKHQGFLIFSQSVVLPARDGSTFLPGLVTRATSAAPPKKGAGQKFELFIDGKKVDTEKVTVK